jgi:hypothetical protein
MEDASIEMQDCELIPKCTDFFRNKMGGQPSTVTLISEKYCKGDKHKCARYVALNKLDETHIPENLFPNQMDKARSLIDS